MEAHRTATGNVQRKQRETWLEENREAIEAYNEHVAQHGVFSTGLRGF
jgi:antitoxin CcdA